MPTPPVPASEARAWIRTGYERVRREPAHWLGMTLAYLVVALVLKHIPFLGNFVLVLITPIMLASALLAARSGTPVAAPADTKAWARALTLDGARKLFQVFGRDDHAFAVTIICILVLGMVILVNISELLITGGSVVSGLTGVSLVGPLRIGAIIGIVIVVALYLLLAMALFYVIPLTLFGNRQPVPAVAESFRACVDHRAALAWFIAPFIAVDLLIMIAFSLSHWLGYLLLALLGVVSLPAFVIGLHASYRTLFERSTASATAPLASGITP